MFATLKSLFNLLAPEQKKSLIQLQVLVILMSVFELLSIASIGPFMAVVARPDLVTSNPKFITLYNFFNCETNYELLTILGMSVLILLAVSAALSLFTTWKLLKFGATLGADLGSRLFTFYMEQSWLYHVSNNSTSMITKIAAEANRTTQQIIQPMLIMFSKIVLASILGISLILINPSVALIGMLLFGFFYSVIFNKSKKILISNGKEISKFSAMRFLTLSEGFGGIKDTLVLNKKEHFINEFDKFGKGLAKSNSINQIISQAPKYIMEVLAFGSIISLVIYLIVSHNGNLTEVLPMLAIYALAGFKLLPALQSIFGSMAQIKANTPAFESIKDDLSNSVNKNVPKDNLVTFKRNIALDSVQFNYPNKQQPALFNINIMIEKNQMIGLVGPSGSGKSTLVDIILGLIPPSKGSLIIDGITLEEEDICSWQKNIGYVPQSIYLSDKSIRENIAFGVNSEEISEEHLRYALKLSHLEEFVYELPKGIETKVGERGVQLSGGQRQRIGIARALYRKPSILVFDEATSALDGVSENVIMDAINELSGEKTIILIAHRLSTVKNCDRIYFLDNGEVTDSGTFDELLENNKTFSTMASHNK